MDARRIAKRYAKALLNNCEDLKSALNCLDELKTISRIIHQSEELTELLEFPDLSRLRSLYERSVQTERYSKETRNFIGLLIEKERLKILSLIIFYFERMMWKSEGVSFIKVKSARPLDEDYIKRLNSKLEEKLGEEVVLDTELDSSLIGSIKLEMDDKVIDGSISNRLNQIKTSILERVKEY